VQLKAATKDLLIKAIFEYRLRNDIEQGDIERDIDLLPPSVHPLVF
jgi:hypothetical protein